MPLLQPLPPPLLPQLQCIRQLPLLACCPAKLNHLPSDPYIHVTIITIIIRHRTIGHSKRSRKLTKQWPSIRQPHNQRRPRWAGGICIMRPLRRLAPGWIWGVRRRECMRQWPTMQRPVITHRCRIRCPTMRQQRRIICSAPSICPPCKTRIKCCRAAEAAVAVVAVVLAVVSVRAAADRCRIKLRCWAVDLWVCHIRHKRHHRHRRHLRRVRNGGIQDGRHAIVPIVRRPNDSGRLACICARRTYTVVIYLVAEKFTVKRVI